MHSASRRSVFVMRRYYMCICVYICVYIYIYIEREKCFCDAFGLPSELLGYSRRRVNMFGVNMCKHIYIYIYIYLSLSLYIYIYIYLYLYLYLSLSINIYTHYDLSHPVCPCDPLIVALRRRADRGARSVCTPATCKHGWSKHGSSIIPSKHYTTGFI